MSSVDDLLDNDRLFAYALTAYGIDPEHDVEDRCLRQVLISDLSDPNSYANSITDTRYRTLAAAFNFGTDGSVTGTAGAQSADQLDATKNQYLANYDDAAQAADSSATSVYSSRINTLSNVDDLLKNDTLYSYALQAFGLDPSEESKSKIRQMLVSDVSNPASFAECAKRPALSPARSGVQLRSGWQSPAAPAKPRPKTTSWRPSDLYGTRVGSSASDTAAAKAGGHLLPQHAEHGAVGRRSPRGQASGRLRDQSLRLGRQHHRRTPCARR